MAFAQNNYLKRDVGAAIGTVTSSLADQNGDTSDTDLGIVGLKSGRIRIVVKSGLSNTNTVRFDLRVGTSTNVTTPEVVVSSPLMTFLTGDSELVWESPFVSNKAAGFQSYKVNVTNSGGTAVFDVYLEAQ